MHEKSLTASFRQLLRNQTTVRTCHIIGLHDEGRSTYVTDHPLHIRMISVESVSIAKFTTGCISTTKNDIINLRVRS